VIIKLGVGSGIVVGFEVDTAFFNGNHAPEVSVHGTFAPEATGVPDAKVISPF
jgi:allantoicase